MTYTRPTHPKLAKAFDDAVQRGYEIRYADETTLTVYRKNTWGCGGLILLLLVGFLTAFIVPIVLFVLGALAPGGQTIT